MGLNWTLSSGAAQDLTCLKNAGHDMAKVGEPCNVDAHANNIPALFMLCPRLCLHMYCTHGL